MSQSNVQLSDFYRLERSKLNGMRKYKSKKVKLDSMTIRIIVAMIFQVVPRQTDLTLQDIEFMSKWCQEYKDRQIKGD